MEKFVLLSLFVFCLITQEALAQGVTIEAGGGLGGVAEVSNTTSNKLLLSLQGYYHLRNNLDIGFEVTYGERTPFASEDVADISGTVIRPESMNLSILMAKTRYTFKKPAQRPLFAGAGIGVSSYKHYVHARSRSEVVRRNLALLAEVGLNLKDTTLSIRYLTRGATANFRGIGKNNNTPIILNSRRLSIVSFVVLYKLKTFK